MRVPNDSLQFRPHSIAHFSIQNKYAIVDLFGYYADAIDFHSIFQDGSQEECANRSIARRRQAFPAFAERHVEYRVVASGNAADGKVFLFLLRQNF